MRHLIHRRNDRLMCVIISGLGGLLLASSFTCGVEIAHWMGV